jgi:TRAP-type C4-dicarboxylate transport system permease small subunit|tara:strand:+ start:625 stop:1167 length:543 start_codon:yes stop_codon:yes gene_type:complete
MTLPINALIALIFNAALWIAVFGGVALAAIAFIATLNIFGRVVGFQDLVTIPGDFGLVGIGTALAVFFFLPWCFLKAGHVSVDILFKRLPKAMQWLIVTLSDLILTILWVVLSHRLWLSMIAEKNNIDVTYVLSMPLWWGYALCMIGASIGCLACFAKLLIDFRFGQYPKGWVIDSKKVF